MMTTKPEYIFTALSLVLIAGAAPACEDSETDPPAMLADTTVDTMDAADTSIDTADPDTGVDSGDTGVDVAPDTTTQHPPPEWSTSCPNDGCPGDSTCDSSLEACRPMLPDSAKSCDASPTTWSPGDNAFDDTSSEWNLDQLGVRGIRISVVDYNQDGWPDVSVRRGGSGPNDFSKDGNRRVWLLRNNQGSGFEDVTQSSELLQRRSDVSAGAPSRPAEVIVWGDVNNDGWPDAYTGFTKPTGDPDLDETAEIMINEGDGTFRLGPSASDARRAGQPDTVSGAAFTDIDRDGQLDLWIGQYDYTGTIGPAQDRAYLGAGDGSFTAATQPLGLTTQGWSFLGPINQGRAHSLAWSVGACDVDGNGTPDLRASSYGRGPNHLFTGTPSATAGAPPSYDNVSVSSGFAYDDNMDWTDNISAQCYCADNPQAQDCGDVPEPTGVTCNSTRGWNHQYGREPFRLGGNNGTTVCEDIDRDGRMDFMTTTIRHWDVGQSSDPSEILYNNTSYDEMGDAEEVSFRRPGREATGLTRQHESQVWDEGDITAAIFDFDNDSRPDIYIGSTDYPGTRGLLYRQTANGTFEQVPPTDGIDHPSSHGVVAADFDRDGDTDLLVGHSRTRCHLGDHCYPPEQAHVRMFENVGDQGRWLQLSLSGAEGTNTDAIGARVTVEPLDESGNPVTTPSGQPVRWTQRVDGGHGHYGLQDSKTIHAGLGDACRARVTVRWPDADLTRSSYVLPAGQRYLWQQGAPPDFAE